MSTSDPQPDTFFPALLTLGPGGNIVELRSQDWEEHGQRGFRLFAAADPGLSENTGGIDTYQVVASWVDVWSTTTPLQVGRLRGIESVNPQAPARRLQIDFANELWFRPLAGAVAPRVAFDGKVSVGAITPGSSLLIEAGSLLQTTGDRAAEGAVVGALPAAPVHGQEVFYSPAAGVRWHLFWDAGVSRWAFLGGDPLTATNEASVATASATYPGAAQGPSVTVPQAGTYDVSYWARMDNGGAVRFAGMTIGQAAADAAHEVAPGLAANAGYHQGRTRYGVTLAAGALSMWYRAPSSTTVTYLQRDLAIVPRLLT